ncbi:DUF4878 domain-containing protein [Rhodococcus sp. X156]|uniref:Rv0361 family membrane protein n=1 Tax=Rhodococcus sp. X156 TaxID=2499145 RepID=UPI000FD8A183|nr:DUF4878 domain-containing protein [Rhodococcus sp. X156]
MSHPQDRGDSGPGAVPHQAPPGPAGPRKGVVAGILGGVVVLIAVAALLFVTLTSSDGAEASPREVADTFMRGVQTQNLDLVRDMSCAENADTLAGEDGAKLPEDYTLGKFDAKFVDDVEKSDTEREIGYSADVSMSHQGEQRSDTMTFSLTVVKQGDAWKVCGLQS